MPDTTARPTRLTERLSGGALLAAMLFPAVFVGAIAWFAWAAVDGLGKHENLAIAVGVVGAIAFLVSTIGFWKEYTGKGLWFGACPVCGEEQYWSYYVGMGDSRRWLACGRCMAQVRIRDRTLSEVRPEERSAEYGKVVSAFPEGFAVPVVRLVREGRIAAPRMPEGCACCGAPATRRIPVERRVAREASRQYNSAVKDLRVVTDASSARNAAGQMTPRPPAALGWTGPADGFDATTLAFGLCDAHDSKDAVSCNREELCFGLYGPYQEFCRLNGLRPAGA